MKQAVVNGRWNLWLPDSIADWDAITGDYTARRGWEFARFESFRMNLRWGDIFFDVGTEHGWISAIIAREFVGAQHMVLIEPSCEFWGNIRMIWKYNGLDMPLATYQGFVADYSIGEDEDVVTDGWPKCAQLFNETGAMAYRSLTNGDLNIPTIYIDDLVSTLALEPTALNIDVEGAEGKVLRGAERLLTDPWSALKHVWVSMHPDLMERDFGENQDDLIMWMQMQGWRGEFLGEDHEEHWHFTRGA